MKVGFKFWVRHVYHNWGLGLSFTRHPMGHKRMIEYYISIHLLKRTINIGYNVPIKLKSTDNIISLKDAKNKFRNKYK